MSMLRSCAGCLRTDRCTWFRVYSRLPGRRCRYRCPDSPAQEKTMVSKTISV